MNSPGWEMQQQNEERRRWEEEFKTDPAYKSECERRKNYRLEWQKWADMTKEIKWPFL